MKTDGVKDDYAQWIPGSDKYELLEDYLGYDVMTGTSFLDPSGDVNCIGGKRKGYNSSVSYGFRPAVGQHETNET